MFAFESEQIGHVEDYSLKSAEEFSKDIILRFEKETIGMFLSGHPVMPFAPLIKQQKLTTSGMLKEEETKLSDGEKISILGVVTQIKLRNTRNNRSMATVLLEDLEGSCEVLVFPNVLFKYESELVEYKVDDKKSIVIINGTVDLKDEGSAKIICDSVTHPNISDINKEAAKKLFLKIPSKDSYEYNSALNLLSQNKGNCEIYVRLADTKTLIKLSDRYYTDANEMLLSNLKELLGNDCVVLR